jgi:hypothetical protein
MRWSALFPLVFLFTLFSCKKEEVTPAEVHLNVQNPYEGAVYQVFDTILVEAIITADVPIIQVQVALNNDKNIRQLPALTTSVNVRSYVLHQQLVISDIHLTEGAYYVAISVTTEDGVSTVYRKVYVGASDRRRSGVYLATSREDITHVYRLDSTGSLIQEKVLAGDFGSIHVNSHDRQIGVVGKVSGDLNMFGSTSWEKVWDVKNEGGTTSFFTAVHFGDRLTFYADRTGALRGRNTSGNVIFSSQVVTGRQVNCIFGNSEYVISEEVAVPGTASDLICRYTSSGIEKQRLLLEGPVEAIIPLSADHYLVSQRLPEGALLRVYNLSTNTFEFRERTINGASVNAAAVVNNEEVALLTNTEVVRFNTTTFEVQAVLSEEINDFAFDETEQTIWTIQDRFIRVYTYPEGKLLSEFEHAAELEGIAIAYTK